MQVYGFITSVQELYAKNKNGKAILRLPTNAIALPPTLIYDLDKDYIIAISNEGRLLCFPCHALPQMTKGKGNKIMAIPSQRASDREEYLIHLLVLRPKQSLQIFAGKRHITLKHKDLQNYENARGRRGSKLPRGFQKVDHIAII